jgi:hypothetical protein
MALLDAVDLWRLLFISAANIVQISDTASDPAKK